MTATAALSILTAIKATVSQHRTGRGSATEQSIERTVTDDTMPTGTRQRTIAYEAPYDQCDREVDYRNAWAEFERRRG